MQPPIIPIGASICALRLSIGDVRRYGLHLERRRGGSRGRLGPAFLFLPGHIAAKNGINAQTKREHRGTAKAAPQRLYHFCYPVFRAAQSSAYFRRSRICAFRAVQGNRGPQERQAKRCESHFTVRNMSHFTEWRRGETCLCAFFVETEF